MAEETRRVEDCLDAPFMAARLESVWCVGCWDEVAGECAFVTEQEPEEIISHFESNSVDVLCVIEGLVQLGSAAEEHGESKRERTLVEALGIRAQSQ